jgi:hypothetical protein
MADLTFLMNADPAGTTNAFYSLAKQYFNALNSTVIDAPAKGQTLEGVFTELKNRKVAQGTINIVSHAVGFGAIEGPLSLADQANGRTMTIAADLQDALAAKTLAPPGPGIITDKTRVVLYGCDVGRSVSFLTLLSGFFGNPGELLAPRRLSVFKQTGTTVTYRQAQSWTLVRKPPQTLGTAAAPPGDWPAFRDKFVADAFDKFGRIALTEIDGDKHLKAILTAAAKDATKAIGPTFFLEEGIDIFPTGTQTAAQAAASVKPIMNGDPVTASVQTAAQVDDTALVTTISGTDAYAANAAKTKFSISVVLLAQVIDQEVPIAEGPGYARITSSKGLAPSPGPKPTGGGTGSGSGSGSGASAENDQLQSVIDQLVAAGVEQDVIDAVTAAAPQGDATDGLPTDTPDPTPFTGDPDYPAPEETA